MWLLQKDFLQRKIKISNKNKIGQELPESTSVEKIIPLGNKSRSSMKQKSFEVFN